MQCFSSCSSAADCTEGLCASRTGKRLSITNKSTTFSTRQTPTDIPVQFAPGSGRSAVYLIKLLSSLLLSVLSCRVSSMFQNSSCLEHFSHRLHVLYHKVHSKCKTYCNILFKWGSKPEEKNRLHGIVVEWKDTKRTSSN